MKKKITFRNFLSIATAVSLLVGTGCSYEEKKPLPRKEIKKEELTPEQKKQQERIDSIYESLRDMPGVMKYNPFLKEGIVKIGFGTPIEDPKVLSELLLYEEHGKPLSFEEKKEVINSLRRGEHIIARTDTENVRRITKEYLKKAEKKAIHLIPNYLSFHPEVQAIILQTELLTNGKLETYKKFCAALRENSLLDAAKECSIRNISHPYYNEVRKEKLKYHSFFVRSKKFEEMDRKVRELSR